MRGGREGGLTIIIHNVHSGDGDGLHIDHREVRGQHSSKGLQSFQHIIPQQHQGDGGSGGDTTSRWEGDIDRGGGEVNVF